MKTQWNVAWGGIVGLRYESIPLVLEMCGVAKKLRADLLHSLRIMEDEVLKVFRENG